MTETAAAAAKAATAPTTFDFAAAVLDRDYPEITVPVYLNEKSVQKYINVKRAVAELELRIAKKDKDGKPQSVEQAEKLAELDAEVQAVVESLRSEQYTITIRGIAPEDTIKLDEKTYEIYPRIFKESTHPLSGATVETEVPEPEREVLFATLLRQAHIIAVERPDGATDTDFSDIEKVKTIWSHLPALARQKVDEAINESTIAVDFYREIADEVF